MVEVVVDTKDLNASTVLLAQFQHARVKLDTTKKLKFSIYSRTQNPEKKILTSRHHDMTYIGSTMDSTVSKDVMKLHVGVVDEASKKMSILPASLSAMLPLQPGDNVKDKLDLSDDGEEDEVMDIATPKTAEEKTQQQYRLVESFGSEKQKRLLANARRSKVDTRDLDSSVNNSLLAAEYQSGEDDSSNVTENVIPVYNADAKTPSEVYNINDVISPAETAGLSGPSRIFQMATPKLIDQWRADKTYPEYVLCHLPTGEGDEDGPVRLYYLVHLINCYRRKRKTLRQSDLASMSDTAQQMILSRYTTPDVHATCDGHVSHVMSGRLRDKLLCHILLLALFIDNFSFDVTVLQKDLQLDNTRIGERLRALGCKVSVVAGTKPTALTAKLTIPLSLPKSAKKSRKRKRNT